MNKNEPNKITTAQRASRVAIADVGLKRMRNPLTILLAVIMAAVCSRALMSGLQHLTIPAGLQLSILSVNEFFVAFSLFTLSFCACAGLAAVVACYLRRYSVVVRCMIVLLPMLVAGGFVTMLKMVQFRDAQSIAGIIGMPVVISLQKAAFHMIPAVAFTAGMLAVAVSMFLRVRNAQPGTASNGGSVTPIGNTGVAEGAPSVS